MTKPQQAFAVLVLVFGYGVVGRLDHDDQARAAKAASPPTLRLVCRDADASAPDEWADRPIVGLGRVMTSLSAAHTRLSCVVITE